MLRKMIDHYRIVMVPLFLGIILPHSNPGQSLDFGNFDLGPLGVWTTRQIGIWTFVLAVFTYQVYTWYVPAKTEVKDSLPPRE